MRLLQIAFGFAADDRDALRRFARHMAAEVAADRPDERVLNGYLNFWLGGFHRSRPAVVALTPPGAAPAEGLPWGWASHRAFRRHMTAAVALGVGWNHTRLFHAPHRAAGPPNRHCKEYQGHVEAWEEMPELRRLFLLDRGLKPVPWLTAQVVVPLPGPKRPDHRVTVGREARRLTV